MAPCRRSDVRGGARIADRGLRVEDREFCAQGRLGHPGNCRRMRAYAAIPCRVQAHVVDIVLFHCVRLAVDRTAVACVPP
eukprot:6786438-Heterocapsa_arctica.AAC.1